MKKSRIKITNGTKTIKEFEIPGALHPSRARDMLKIIAMKYALDDDEITAHFRPRNSKYKKDLVEFFEGKNDSGVHYIVCSIGGISVDLRKVN